MKNLFIDSDVILDLLLKREPHFISAAVLLEKAKSNEIKLHTSSVCAVNVHYILKKSYSADEIGVMLNKFFIYVGILTVDKEIILLALNSNFRDFEDAVQYYAALKNNLETILTRNTKDYRVDDIPVMTPDEFLYSL